MFIPNEKTSNALKKSIHSKLNEAIGLAQKDDFSLLFSLRQPISDNEHLNRSMNHRIFKCIMSQYERSLVIRFPVSSFNRKKIRILVTDMIIEYFRDPFKLERQ